MTVVVLVLVVLLSSPAVDHCSKCSYVMKDVVLLYELPVVLLVIRGSQTHACTHVTTHETRKLSLIRHPSALYQETHIAAINLAKLNE